MLDMELSKQFVLWHKKCKISCLRPMMGLFPCTKNPKHGVMGHCTESPLLNLSEFRLGSGMV